MTREEFIQFILSNILCGNYYIKNGAVYRNRHLDAETNDRLNRVNGRAYNDFGKQWESIWIEAKKRYYEIPLIKALA